MSIWRIIFANLKFSRRQHLGTCLGLSLATMLLVGSLCIGDSIQAALTNQATERTGSVSHVFLSEEGYFYSDLADRIRQSKSLNNEIKLAPVLMTKGTLSSPDGKYRASGLTVLGIDPRFFHFTNGAGPVPDMSVSGFWASPALFNEIKMEIGSRLVLRVEEPSLFSRDAPLSGERDSRFISWNRPLLGGVDPSVLGNFSLRASMNQARTVFVPLSMLQQDMFVSFEPEKGRTDFCNLLLVEADTNSILDVEETIKSCWTLGDAGLEIPKLRHPDTWNLRSRSVFLPDPLVAVAKEINPRLESELTYLVNAIRKPSTPPEKGSSLIPYSMVTGVEVREQGMLGLEWKRDEIAVNDWTAKDLNLSIGDRISLEYFVVGQRRHLKEENRTFRVAKVLPMPDKLGPGEESDWSPKFPGLMDAENCGEWDTGIPIKHKIRTKDEKYWDDYRGTPKAFISLDAAQEMWGNRWGRVTGLRIHGKKHADSLGTGLLGKLRPADFGVRRLGLKQDSIEATEGPVDFSQLFMGFGFFVLLAGLTLSALLFGFSLEQRNRQVGLLRSFGYTPERIKFIIWLEIGSICFLGTAMGVGWSWFFGRTVLWMLNDVWGAAVAQLQILYAPQWESVLWGVLGSFLVALFTLALTTYGQFKRSPMELLQSGEFVRSKRLSLGKLLVLPVIMWAELLLWMGVIGLMVYTVGIESLPGPSFFGIGALVVTAGILGVIRVSKRKTPKKPHDILFHLDFRFGRKVVVVGLLAVGTFLVLGAGAFRQELPQDFQKWRSGTGGFSHIIQTSLPLYDDLLSNEGIELFDLDPNLLKGSQIVSLRTHGGDDASCLNLHKSTSPPLYGLPVDLVMGRFPFAQGNWANLQKPYPTNVVPAVVDQNTMMWTLKKGIGDRITYFDGKGEKFEVEICAVVQGSFLQGGLYISEKNWLSKFPQRGGYQQFWLGGGGMESAVVDHIEDRLLNYGVHSETTLERLGRLKQVENTYLSIFQALGALGVLLGTIGLLIVVLRNLWERRQEQAILSALGYSLTQLHEIYFNENRRVLFFGLTLGLLAGIIALFPTWMNDVYNYSWFHIFGFGISLLLLAWVSLNVGVRIGLRSAPIDSLRNE